MILSIIGFLMLVFGGLTANKLREPFSMVMSQRPVDPKDPNDMLGAFSVLGMVFALFIAAFGAVAFIAGGLMACAK